MGIHMALRTSQWSHHWKRVWLEFSPSEMPASLELRMPVHGETTLPEHSCVLEQFASLRTGRFSLCPLDSVVHLDGFLPSSERCTPDAVTGLNGLSAASRSCCAGGMVCLPSLVFKFLFSAVMPHKAVLISNLFQAVCGLSAASCCSHRPEDQAEAVNCLPGLTFSCLSALQTECHECLDAALED